MKWKRIKPHQFDWMNYLVGAWCLALILMIILSIVMKERTHFIWIAAMFGIGVLCIATIRHKFAKIRTTSNLMEEFIRKNNLCQSHYTFKRKIFREKEIEIMDYYPQIDYVEIACDNVFRIRFRLDGSAISQKFRTLEQALADMFYTVCTDIVFERGYITYCFELQKQKQLRIETQNDIPSVGQSEIMFSDSMVWNWKETPHLLLAGVTKSGKSTVALYIIACLVNQGVRVIYCDPKNDDTMRFSLKNMPSVTYVTKENEIARVVREIEEEVRLREQDLKEIGIKEAEFNPVFILFDELIAFSMVAEKKTYDETIKRLSAIVVAGRSKRVYAGLILQRPDTEFIGGGAIRDNLGCRICMGNMSEIAYKMAFGSDFSHIKNYRNEIGAGLIYRQGVDSKPREFVAPFICKGAL